MRVCFLLSFIGGLLAFEALRADTIAPPGTETTVSSNGKFIFVMIPAVSLEVELKQYNPEHQKVVKAIRELYRKTGLYKNDGSKEPLWTVDWYDGVAIAADGIYMVRYDGSNDLIDQNQWNVPVSREELKQRAFTIYAKDKPIRSFTIDELVDEPKLLKKSVSHFRWEKKTKIVENKNYFQVDTLDRNRVVIDLTNGAILEKKKIPKNSTIPEGSEIKPETEWFGHSAGEAEYKLCGDTPIVTQAQFEKLWKALKPSDPVLKIDFAKRFVRVWASQYGIISRIGFIAEEDGEEVRNFCETTSNPANAADAFGYAIGVFSLEHLELADGKVILKSSHP